MSRRENTARWLNRTPAMIEMKAIGESKDFEKKQRNSGELEAAVDDLDVLTGPAQSHFFSFGKKKHEPAAKLSTAIETRLGEQKRVREEYSQKTEKLWKELRPDDDPSEENLNTITAKVINGEAIDERLTQKPKWEAFENAVRYKEMLELHENTNQEVAPLEAAKTVLEDAREQPDAKSLPDFLDGRFGGKARREMLSEAQQLLEKTEEQLQIDEILEAAHHEGTEEYYLLKPSNDFQQNYPRLNAITENINGTLQQIAKLKPLINAFPHNEQLIEEYRARREALTNNIELINQQHRNNLFSPEYGQKLLAISPEESLSADGKVSGEQYLQSIKKLSDACNKTKGWWSWLTSTSATTVNTDAAGKELALPVTVRAYGHNKLSYELSDENGKPLTISKELFLRTLQDFTKPNAQNHELNTKCVQRGMSYPIFDFQKMEFKWRTPYFFPNRRAKQQFIKMLQQNASQLNNNNEDSTATGKIIPGNTASQSEPQSPISEPPAPSSMGMGG